MGSEKDKKKKNIAELTRCSVAQFKAMPKLPLCVLADNVRSMHNIGALFRTADAFRIHSIILAGISGCPPHPEISKSALGAEESVEWRHVADAVQESALLQQQDWKICVLEQTHNSILLHEFNPLNKSNSTTGEVCAVEKCADEKYVLVLGNEVNGVDQRVVDMADYVLEIPQEGTKHSLNVSTSAAIAMYHFYNLLK